MKIRDFESLILAELKEVIDQIREIIISKVVVMPHSDFKLSRLSS